MIKAVLFDLDGTLIDSAPVILRCFDSVFKEIFPHTEISEDEKLEFLGPTLVHTFSRYTEDQSLVERAVKLYVHCSLLEHDNNNIKAFPNAYELLEILKARNIKIGVVTSKRSDAAAYGLKLNGLLEFVDILIGSDSVKNHKPHPEALNKALKELNLSPSEVIYVGDHENDILAAQAAKIKSVGVTYSYRLPQIESINPDYLISNLLEIKDIVLKWLITYTKFINIYKL